MAIEREPNDNDGLAFENRLIGFYDSNGIVFRYPKEWTLTQENHGGELAVTVESPGTAFWSILLFRERPHPQHVIESAIETLRGEYEELDIYPSTDQLCGVETVSRDVEFVCLELINSAFLRAFETEHVTALVLFQANDAELEHIKDIMDSISESLEFVDPGFEC